MKNGIRTGFLLAVLGLAGLLSGCVSQQHSSGLGTGRDFEIVETSTKRMLNAKEMVQLRDMVRDYLEKEGSNAGDVYYVKVYFKPVQEGAPEDWLVVRYSSGSGYTPSRFNVLAANPSYYDDYYFWYGYDYYPFSPFGFSRFSLGYYDYPYNYGYYPYYYYPTGPSRTYTGYSGHQRDHQGSNDHDGTKGSQHHRPGTVAGYPPPANSYYHHETPRVTHTRWNGSVAENNHSPNSGIPPVRSDTGQRWRSRVASPTDYTPAANASTASQPTYSYPRQNGTHNSTPRVSPSNRDGDVTKYERPRHDNNNSGSRDNSSRSRESAPVRSNNESTPRQQSYSQPVSAPASSSSPSRSDSPPSYSQSYSRSEPATQSSGSHDSRTADRPKE